MPAPSVSVSGLVRALEHMAELLKAQHADPDRVRAYAQAAEAVAQRGERILSLWQEGGPLALEGLPHIGPSLASALDELLRTGRLRRLERLEGEVSPVQIFAQVSGIGDKLAHEIHEQLHIDSLEQLELAAHDGRLLALPSFGQRRVQMVQGALSALLGHAAKGHAHPHWPRLRPVPKVSQLLAIDRHYRRKAELGELPRIAPRRFNPHHEVWLPVLHLEHDGYHFTVMFSNTARAHHLHRTRDWVVFFYDRDGYEGQCTVVTEHEGALSGKRVVRGREDECARHYDRHHDEPDGRQEPPPLDSLLNVAEPSARDAHSAHTTRV